VTGLLHRKGLHAYTHATLVSPVHLKEDLALTRKRGYSFDDEEHALACAASRPVFLTSTASRLPPSPSPGRFRV
jgi:DNA-binding IclR family transcriptional regulator